MYFIQNLHQRNTRTTPKQHQNDTIATHYQHYTIIFPHSGYIHFSTVYTLLVYMQYTLVAFLQFTCKVYTHDKRVQSYHARSCGYVSSAHTTAHTSMCPCALSVRTYVQATTLRRRRIHRRILGLRIRLPCSPSRLRLIHPTCGRLLRLLGRGHASFL